MNPSDVLEKGPEGPQDLIGKAATVAKVLCGKADSGSLSAVKILLYGEPGIGKSAICRILSRKLATESWNAIHISAAQVTGEMVKDWMQSLRHLRTTWAVWWIEEADAVNPGVEKLLLQMLDTMGAQTALLMTSNTSLGELSDRLQSRMQAIEVTPPDEEEVVDFVYKRWPEVGLYEIEEVVEANNGDVRATLNDIQMLIDMAAYGGG